MTLIGDQTYRLSQMLRGLHNSDDMMMDVVRSGARVVILDAGLTRLDIDTDFIEQAVEIDVSAAGRSGVAAEHIYAAAHLRPLSIAHLSAEPTGDGVKLSWIPRNIDGSDGLNTSAQFEISWPEGSRVTSEISEILPISPGSGTEITIRAFDPIGGFGRGATIRV